jgi:hypothetical protein
MKAASTNCRRVLSSGSFSFWYEADLWYDNQRRIASLPIDDVQLTEDDSRAVKAYGGCSVIWIDDFARSVIPVNIGDLFAPFGSELAMYAVVSAGAFQERIPMGWMQIVDVPTMRDRTMFFGHGRITTGTRLEFKLQDRFVQIQDDPFDVPSAPSQLASVWAEIGAVTGMKLVRSMPDSAITRSVVYQDDRLQAVLDLADLLGGVPYAAPDGTLTMRPKAWTAPVDTLRAGDSGTLVDIQKGMSADGVYNKVAFRGQGDQQDQILAFSEVTDGPLRVRNTDGTRSPAHRRPTFRSNQFVNTTQQAKAYTDSELARVSTLSAVSWPIEEVWNPLRELGDVITIIDEHDTQVLARVKAIDRTGRGTQKVTVVRG